MKNTKPAGSLRRLVLTAAAIGMAGLLSGCQLLPLMGLGASFDASGYVQSGLDCLYKAQYDAYCAITDSTEEEAAQAYEEGMETESQTFELYFELTLSDTDRQKVIDAYKKVYQQADYTVEKAAVKKEEASTQYLVEVRVRPLLIFDDILTEYNAFVDEMNGRYSQEDVDAMGEEEYAAYLSQYVQKIASLMESHADTVTYGEEQSVTIHVQPDSDGIYEIPEEDLQAVDALIIQY